ncbi:MAG: ABC transporter permease [Anaerolineae bacterium]|nr:ABC transporter permease [Anaerolineae bacterium]
MSKSFSIFKHEFLRRIKSAGFLILTLSVPIAVLLGIGIFKLAKNLLEDTDEVVSAIGYVDEVGIFDGHTDMGETQLVPFTSREDANQALSKGEVTEYFVIPEDYISSGIIQRYTLENEASTPALTAGLIWRFLTANLLDEKVAPETIDLIITPLNLEVTWITEEGEIALEESNLANIIIPGVFSLLLSLTLMFSTYTLVGGLGEEKESRLIEVLFSSVSVRQLLISKVLALGVAGLLQVLVWLISAPLLLDLASSSFSDLIRGIEIPTNFIALGVVYFILGYLLFAVLSIGVGAISSSANEANALSMFYTMASFIPLWFFGLIVAYPNSPIWVGLMIFPVTAPIQTMVMLGITEIPLWLILTSIGVLVLSIIGGLYLVIKIFRMYMLMYGKRPSLGEIYRNLIKA